MLRAFFAFLLSLVFVAPAGCSYHTSLRLNQFNNQANTGHAFVGDELVQYQTWSIVTMGDGKFIDGKGAGEVFARIAPELEQLRTAKPERTEQTGDSSSTIPFAPYQRHSLDAWNELGYQGWLFSGEGWWSHAPLPRGPRLDVWHDPSYKFRSQESRRSKYVDLFDEATGTVLESLVLIAIIPPVVAVVDRGCLGEFSSRSIGVNALWAWNPERDRDCVVTALWSLTRVPGEQRIRGTRLIPEGATMTLGDVLEKGPSLWRDELEAMRELVEPKPLKPS